MILSLRLRSVGSDIDTTHVLRKREHCIYVSKTEQSIGNLTKHLKSLVYIPAEGESFCFSTFGR